MTSADPDREDRLASWAALRLLRPLVASHPLTIGLIVILGVLASAAEGIGITLFIPLVQSIEPISSTGGLPAALSRLVEGIPFERRFVVLPLLILGAILLKNALFFANHAVVSQLVRGSAHSCGRGSSIA